MSQSKAQLTNPFGTVNITDGVNVTGVITATTFIGDGTALTGIALTGDINTSGIITASEFYGYGGDLDNVGLGTDSSINTTGIITAGQFYGDGSLLTNIGGAFVPLTFNPTNGQTNVGLTTNIVITFNKPIQAGVGTITLRTDSASGTIEESFDVTSSDRLTFSAGTLTIDPTASLSGLTTYYTVLPAGTVKDAYGLDDNTLIDNYSFTTQQLNYELWAWGRNDQAGELGLNDRTQYSSPVQVPGTQWQAIVGNYNTMLGTKSDGTLWAWGSANYSPFNDGVNRSSPTQVPGTQWSTDEKAVSVTLSAQFALKTDGTLWSWGTNTFGILGQNDTTPRSSPVQIPGTQWRNITVNDYYYHVGATKIDGTLWSWGYNEYGQLGQNNRTTYSSPIQIPGTQWDYASFGFTSLAKKSDGTIWSWGSNYYGALGVNDGITRSSPVQIPGTQWSSISNNNIHCSATKSDGTLWLWGYNGVGALGQNTVNDNRSSPTQVPGTQWGIEYKDIGQLYRSSAVLKTDGTLWVWGSNTRGVLGLNDQIQRSSPIQIPGTQWYRLNKGTVYSVFAIKQVAP